MLSMHSMNVKTDQPASGDSFIVSRVMTRSIGQVLHHRSTRTSDSVWVSAPYFASANRDIATDEVEPRGVDDDIKLFLEYHLKEPSRIEAISIHKTPWPAAEIFRFHFQGWRLFIYASTVINSWHLQHTPQRRLRMITNMPDSSFKEAKLQIDHYIPACWKRMWRCRW